MNATQGFPINSTTADIGAFTQPNLSSPNVGYRYCCQHVILFQEADDNTIFPGNISNSTLTGTSPLFLHLSEDASLRIGMLCLIVINVLGATFAFGLNLMVIVTLAKTSSLWIPSNILVMGLAISDFGIAFFTEPAYCCFLVSIMKENVQWINFFIRAMTWGSSIFIGVSLSMITAITIDRFLAITLHLRYQNYVTVKRTIIVVVIIWMMVIIYVIAPLTSYLWILLAGISSSTTILLMIRISCVVRKHSLQIHAQQQAVQFNITRYKKTVNTMYFIIGSFVICVIPHCIASAIMVSYTDTGTKISITLIAIAGCTTTLLNISSLFNPLLYFWRIQGMRYAAKQILQNAWKTLKTC